MMKKTRSVLIVIVIIVFAVLGIVMASNSQRNIEKVEVISIRNGNNGELIKLTEETSNAFVSEFNVIGKHISGINLWRSGYNYKIYWDEELTKDITVRGENIISVGIFDYKTDVNVIEMIEKHIEK